MSQHYFTNERNRKVLYGSDKPTGGFFFTEFYNDDEIGESDSDVVVMESALTIREIIKNLSDNQGYILSGQEIYELVEDWMRDPEPTPLQYNISLMFQKDLPQMLQRSENDLYGFVNEQYI